MGGSDGFVDEKMTSCVRSTVTTRCKPSRSAVRSSSSIRRPLTSAPGGTHESDDFDAVVPNELDDARVSQEPGHQVGAGLRPGGNEGSERLARREQRQCDGTCPDSPAAGSAE